MNELKQRWQQIATKIDAMSLRERAIVFAMLALILVTLVNVTVLDAQFAKLTALANQVKQDQSQIAGFQAEITAMVTNHNRNPDADKQAQLDQIRLRAAQIRTQLESMQKGLVSPDRMASLLGDLLRRNGKLRLVALHTLPTTGMDGAALAPSKMEAPKPSPEAALLAKASAASVAPGQQAKPQDKVPGNQPDKAGTVYRHGVELTIEGDYLDMLDYMTTLEGMPWQLIWGQANLTADENAKLTLTLTLYTLSLDKKWLNI